MKISRRGLLKGSLLAGGILIAGMERRLWSQEQAAAARNPFHGGKKLDVLNFDEELPIDMETVEGSELDGRLYSDLSKLTPEAPLTTTQNFYLRTCASHLLVENEKDWTIRIGALLREPEETKPSDCPHKSSPSATPTSE